MRADDCTAADSMAPQPPSARPRACMPPASGISEYRLLYPDTRLESTYYCRREPSWLGSCRMRDRDGVATKCAVELRLSRVIFAFGFHRLRGKRRRDAAQDFRNWGRHRFGRAGAAGVRDLRHAVRSRRMYAQRSSAWLRGSATRRRYAASVSGEHPSLRRP